MAKKYKSRELEELEKQQRRINRKVAKARDAEAERRGLGGFRDVVKDVTDNHNELVERQAGYDTTDKARTFGFGAFDGAVDGALVFTRVDAVYAVEKDPNERFTMLKTVDGPLAVQQSPDQVFNEFVQVRFAGSAERVREMQSELLRREDRVRKEKEKAEKRAKKKKKAAEADAPEEFVGPDFASVSDALSGIDPQYDDPEEDSDD